MFFLHLAHCIAWQFINKQDALGLFVFGERSFERGGDCRFVQRRALLPHHDGGVAGGRNPRVNGA